MNEIILEMKNIYKRFGDVTVLNDVNFKVKRGEIHALCGENGAGKSTLMKVLSGVYPHGTYEGDIVYNGEVKRFGDIKESEKIGISIIHQELALIPYLSIAENIFIGNEMSKGGIINWDHTYKRARELCNIVGLYDDIKASVGSIGVGKQQLVEIAKAISKNADLLILDEPTAALNEDDSENLLILLKEFRKKGMTCIIISHKLNEITEIADSITILRDGQTIKTLSKEKQEISEDEIIKGMVGRSLENRYPHYESNPQEVYFEVNHWNVNHPSQEHRQMVKDVSFNIRRGEIIGIAGLMGAGRTELALSLFGRSYGKYMSGEIRIDGKPVVLKNVQSAINHGVAYATEDRKTNGLVLMNDINHNVSLASLSTLSKHSVMNEQKEIVNTKGYKEKLNIKATSIFQNTGNLSGGNQQKVVLAKWLSADPEILFLDEPTRGIDVGAKYEIYSIIQSMAKAGKSVCIISSELPELLGMCDRIYTMNNGRFTNEFSRSEATQEILMKYMTMENKKEYKANE